MPLLVFVSAARKRVLGITVVSVPCKTNDLRLWKMGRSLLDFSKQRWVGELCKLHSLIREPNTRSWIHFAPEGIKVALRVRC